MNPSIKDYPFIAIGSAKINANAIAYIMPGTNGSITIRMLSGGGNFQIEAKHAAAVMKALQAFVFPGMSDIEASISHTD